MGSEMCIRDRSNRHALLTDTADQQTATMHSQTSVTVRHEDLRACGDGNPHSIGGLRFTSTRHQPHDRVQLAVGEDRDHELDPAVSRRRDREPRRRDLSDLHRRGVYESEHAARGTEALSERSVETTTVARYVAAVDDVGERVHRR